MARLMREYGISQLACRARDALRMRVSMSAMGSVMLMALPARLRDARDFAGERQLAEANPAQREAANERARPSADLAAIVRLHFVARRTLRFDDERLFGQPGLPV